MDGGGKEHLAALYRMMGSKQRPWNQTRMGRESSSGKPILWIMRQHETFQTRMICVCQPDLSTVRGSYAVQTYREGSKKASMLEKTILDRTYLLKHGTLSPESLHAESQWDRPQRGRPGGYRSELSEPIPGFVHGSLPKPSEWRQSPCGCVNRANVRGQTTADHRPNCTRSITFE